MPYLSQSQVSGSQNLLEHRHGPEVGRKGFHQVGAYVLRNVDTNHGLSVCPGDLSPVLS